MLKQSHNDIIPVSSSILLIFLDTGDNQWVSSGAILCVATEYHQLPPL